MAKIRSLAAAAAATIAAAAIHYTQTEKTPNDNQHRHKNNEDKKTKAKCYHKEIKRSRQALLKHFNELGLPGVVIGVTVDGNLVWAEGFGMANVETQTPCHASTKMRIASISKPITSALMAQLRDKGLLDLDREIQNYVPYFPHKTVKGKPVTITARFLACHKSGVRHYKSMEGSDDDGGPEFYLKDRFKNVEESVALFKEDDLLFLPGEKFEYTTHGYTLLSAVIEGAAKESFHKLLKIHLDNMGLRNTHLDEIPTIIYDRASYYRRNSKGRLVNAELTDNSYKWAGGGLVSNVEDLLKFANIMLYSYQQAQSDRPGFLPAETVKELWCAVEGTKQSWSQAAGYGLGWTVVPREEAWLRGKPRVRHHVGHSGGAVGASSVLVIYPHTANLTNRDHLQIKVSIGYSHKRNMKSQAVVNAIWRFAGW